MKIDMQSNHNQTYSKFGDVEIEDLFLFFLLFLFISAPHNIKIQFSDKHNINNNMCIFTIDHHVDCWFKDWVITQNQFRPTKINKRPFESLSMPIKVLFMS